jgi:drug/metabolite transporter (DMT)-like permease
MLYLGELAAVATAFCWSSNSVLFTYAGRRVGSASVNLARLWLAVGLAAGLHAVLFGVPWPAGAGAARLGWLALSGVIGFAVADALLFEAFLLIGPRISMLLTISVPVFSAALAWLALGEVLGVLEILAIAVTLAGIAGVVAERTPGAEAKPPHWRRGLLYGLGGSLGQAVGLLFSRYGLAGDFSPVSATVIRLAAGAAALGVFALLRGDVPGHFHRMRDGRALGQILVGAVTGPVVGVILSLYAITHAPMGIAATLMSLSPVILLPAGRYLFEERFTWRAIAGTLLAMAGASALFFL